MYRIILTIGLFLFVFNVHSQKELARRAYWGVSYEQQDKKVLITRVSEGFSFDEAKVQVGDTVRAVNDKPVSSAQDFRTALSNKKAGYQLQLTIERKGEKKTLKVLALPFPFEKVEGVKFEYSSFKTSQGDHLRTIVSKPANHTGKLPAILFIQWLSCDAIDQHPQYKDGNIQLIHDLSQAGYLVMRTEKPGVGDSKGKPCSEYAFNYELQIHQEALTQLKKRADVNVDQIIIFGSSMGGTMAPMVAQNESVKGLIVTGCYYKTWYEHILEIERRISKLSGDSPVVTYNKMRQWSKFYSLYLNDKMTPAAIIEKHPEFKELWQDEPAHQYGRPVSFYMEANEHNVAKYWQKIKAPTLVIYGEYDWIMSRTDHLMIVETMQQEGEKMGTFIEVPRAGHGLTLSENQQAAFDSFSTEYDPNLSVQVLNWLKSFLKE